MAGDGERAEGTEIAPVAEAEEGEGDYYKEDGFFVYVPAEEEGGVSAESYGANEGLPGGVEEELE